MPRPIRDELGAAAGVENLPWPFTGTLVVMLVVSRCSPERSAACLAENSSKNPLRFETPPLKGGAKPGTPLEKAGVSTGAFGEGSETSLIPFLNRSCREDEPQTVL